MKYIWNVTELEDKHKNVVRLIYSRYSKKSDRIKLVKRLLKALSKKEAEEK